MCVLPGCGDGDDPTVPDPGVNSCDDVIAQFESSLRANDAEALIALFDTDTGYFSFRFRSEDVDGLSLPTSYLNTGEMTQVWRNLFSGEEILNHAGVLTPALTRLEFTPFERTTLWHRPDCGDASWFDMVNGVQHAYYRVKFSLHQENPSSVLVADVLLDFKVRPPCTDDSFCEGLDTYALSGINSDIWAENEDGHFSFGELVNMYYSNEAPDIDLTVVINPENSLEVWTNSCNSQDAGIQVTDGQTRWRFLPDGQWTDWSNNCQAEYEYSSYGEKTVSVEVRDHWGLSSHLDYVIELIP